MALVTWARYVSFTNDTTSVEEDVETALGLSQSLLEEYLGRELESGERTETLQVREGRVYPSVTPITEADAYTIDGNALSDASALFSDFWVTPRFVAPMAEITYTGGFTSATLPVALARAIANGAKELLTSPVSSLPQGATSVRLGDAAVTFALPIGTVLQAFSGPLVSRWKRRRV